MPPAAQDQPAPRPRPAIAERLSLAGAFVLLALRYWLTVYPHAGRQIRRLNVLAAAIPDPVHRQLAQEALAKRSNLEGAAAFAALAPARARAATTRALVCFQAIYNYADTLAERPIAHDPDAPVRAHSALLAALSTDPSTPPAGADVPYLTAQVGSCRHALAALPCTGRILADAQLAAREIWAFQTHSSTSLESLQDWARTLTSEQAGLQWWEAAGAAGSSLSVHALIAAAARPSLEQRTVERLRAAYGGPIGALHSLLDSLIDEEEDAAGAQPSLISFYPDRSAAATAMGELARSARGAARGLPHGRRHVVLVAGMASLYLSDPYARTPRALSVARAVRAGIGSIATPALAVFALRRAAGRLKRPVQGPHAPAAGAEAERPPGDRVHAG